MATGTVKWFNNQKGYGFIILEDGRDVFVHYSAVVQEGYKTLQPGEEVEFELVNSERGEQAKNVVKVAAPQNV